MPDGVNPACIAARSGKPMATHARRATCRGCGVRFRVKPGAAGQFCARACYENPTRVNRSRTARRATALAGKGQQP